MEASLFQLEGKSALVVGGGQGIGESTARFLALVGCGVAVADVVKERADRVANVVAGLGQPSVSVVGDVFDHIQAKEIVERAERELGGLDALVTIVGQAAFSPLLDMTPEQWDFDQRRNLRYFVFTAREVARLLIARGRPGAIVCISSVKGLQSGPQQRRLRRGEGRHDKLGAYHSRRVGAPQHPRQRDCAGHHDHAAHSGHA